MKALVGTIMQNSGKKDGRLDVIKPNSQDVNISLSLWSFADNGMIPYVEWFQ